MKKPQISKKSIKKFNNFKQTVSDAFNTLWSTIKVVGSGAGGAYLVLTGIQQNNVVFMALGAVLVGFGIMVLVTIAHLATKSARA